MATSFRVNEADLTFILRQIKIAEAHSGGISLTQAIQNEFGLSPSDANLVPFGLRTVDGSLNNLAPGQENFGAAGQPFPRLLDPQFLNDTDGDQIDLDGPGGMPPVQQGDYGQPSNVIDADPRTISNLIVNQTVDNPAALYAALKLAGITGIAATAAVAAIQSAHGAHQNAQTALIVAQAQYDAALSDVYAGPSLLADLSADLATTAQAMISALGASFFVGATVDATDMTNLGNAVAAAEAASIAAQDVVASLAGLPEEATAQAIATNSASLLASLQLLQANTTLGEPVDFGEEIAAVFAANGAASGLVSDTTALTGTLAGMISGAIDLPTATANLAAATAAVATTHANYTGVLESNGVVVGADGGVEIPNLSPDIGLSPSFNAWMTFFGQFFDHGLDLVTKSGNGTVYIPLEPDDPLITHGPDGIAGSGDEVPPHLAFMAVTRAAVDANGNAENTTTPFVDQNQTYTSHPSHQVFLRAFTRVDIGDGNGMVTRATGGLLDGGTGVGSLHGAPANWGEVKDQAQSMLGIKLNDFDVHSAPLLLTDAYGEFIPGAHGYAQLVMQPDANHSGVWLQEGNPDGSVTTAGAYTTGHAFLNDIAHHAAPGMYDSDGDHIPDAQQVADSDPGVGDDHNGATYDDEMLNAHFITGDGRGNENIALTTVHSVFHSEHNRLLEANKATILESAADGDLSFLNEWLLVDVATVPTDLSTLIWDGERLFQASRFVTEMQYQHLVFEEFARRIQPAVDPFVFTHSPDVDAAIVAEFAHTVYRFGHSMLTDTVDRLDNGLNPVNGDSDQVTLIEAFLNPQMFMASGANLDEVIGNIVRGTTRDIGNEMDEFVVPALQSNLLGLPLDLAAINIARGRETGIPSLNEARAQFYEDYGLADLKPYTSWLDFAQHIKNPASIINFIAAYGTHPLITGEATLEGMRGAAMALVTGVDQTLSDGRVIAATTAQDRAAFLNATGAYATPALGGMNNIDFWIGGLAEELNEFGGMLGSTFNLVFEFQMERLQTGDRFYYLSRTQGTNLLNQLEPNTFTDLVMRNSSLGDIYSTHLSASLFMTPDNIFELDRGIAQTDYNPDDPTSIDPIHDDPFLQLIDPRVVRDYAGASQIEVNGVMHDVGGLLKYSGGEHVVLGGTEGNDTLLGDKGIDALWGDGGNDYLNAGMESDNVFGGAGDDIIEDPFGDDVLRGEEGNDVISAGSGLDLIFGGAGQDYIILGMDDKEAFGGEGNDFMLGGTGNEFLLGGEGDDWIEGGNGFDVIAGDNTELFFNSSIVGHDVAWGQQNDQDYDLESGDDIALSGPGIQRFEGMFGFDWASGKYDSAGVKFDFAIPIFTTITADILKDRFDQVEAASGWIYDDVLDGDDRGHINGGSSAPDSVPTELFRDHLLTQEGIDRIAGLHEWFGSMDGTDARQTLFGGPSAIPGSAPVSTYRDGNILMGGGGSDFLRGRGGYDLLDGDAWLNVRIKIVHNGVTYSAESLSTDTTVAGPHAGLVFNTNPDGSTNFDSPAFGGRSLNALVLDGTINPGNMSIIREILYDQNPENSIDTAVFQGTFAEYEIEGSVDLNGDGDFNDAGEFTGAVDVDGDGFISVRDRDTGTIGATVDGVTLSSRGALTDDRDLLKNIEQLQFADRIVPIAGNNQLATGTVTINDDTPFGGLVTPYVGQVLTATLSNFSDADGIPLAPNGLPVGLTFEWQTTEIGSNAGWATIQTSTTYTVRSVDPGHALRAVAVFKDSKGVTERINSAATDNPTAAYSVAENSATGTVVGLQIPFSVDYDAQPINGQPPADVDLTTLYHEIDPANDAGGRFTVISNGVDFNGFPRYSLVVAQGGPGALNYEAGVHTTANQSHQFIDNQYQVVINTYDAPGGTLVAVRQFTVLLNNVEPELVAIAPVLDLSGSSSGNVRDDFSPAGYAGNDGSANWAGNWIETNDTGNNGGAGGGDIDVNGGRLRFGESTDGNEIITRGVNLSGATAATLSFDWQEDDRDTDEDLLIQAFDGSTWQTIATMAGSVGNSTGTQTVNLTAAQIGAHSAIRFATVNAWENGENFYVDNVNIAFSGPGAPGNNYIATFDEDGASVAISSGAIVTDADSPLLLSATITLTNAQPGDALNVGALPAGMSSILDTSASGKVTLYLVGMMSTAAYQQAINAVRYVSTSQNPNPVPGASPRVIEVSVYDGQVDSNVATTSVTVNAINDAPNATNDTILTNISGGSPIVVPEWALMANDTDPDSATDITAVGGANGVGSLSLATNAGSVTFVDTTPLGGSFSYTLSDGSLTDTATATVLANNTASDTFSATSYSNNNGAANWAGNWTEINDGGGNGGASGGDIDINNNRLRFGSGTDGDESISRAIDLTGATAATLSFNWEEDDRDAGEDVIVQAFNGTTWDTIGTMAGSANNGTGTFTATLTTAQIGAHSAIRFATAGSWGAGENFYVDNVSIAFTRPGLFGLAGNQILVGDGLGTMLGGGLGNDIVLAGGGDDSIGWNANSGVHDGHDFVDGGTGTDTFTIYGNDEDETYRVFSLAAALAAGLTNFRADAEIVITRNIAGAAATNADIVAELDSIEEIVINTGAGTDVVSVHGDFTPTSLFYNTIRVNGTDGDAVDLNSLQSAHRVLLDTGDGPQQAVNPNFAPVPSGGGASLGGGGTEAPSTGSPQGSSTSDVALGNAEDEVLIGTDAADTILGRGGNDTVFGGAGNDNVMGGSGEDMLFGDNGADRIFGNEGSDFISGGQGNDLVFGGTGDDRFVAEAGDGNDSYYGNQPGQSGGVDTLDMSAITANISANLGGGLMGRGAVYSSETGSDTLWNVSNIITGAGDDVIIANNAVNIIDGGSGNDIFRFESASAANGDTIATFQPGDKIDLSGMDANTDLAGAQTFTLVTGAFSGSGQLMVSQETQGGEMVTIVTGNLGGGAEADFRLSINGAHSLTATDFVL